MPSKKARQSQAATRGTAQKKRPHRRKADNSTQSISQTNQPYEQDVKRRIGQFSGVGEPPLIKK
jgi:hypothetical protein